MQITTQALVIRVMNVGENDRLITLLTKDKGVIKAFAASAKKLKNKYHSGTSFLCYSSFILEEVKDTYRVRDASLIKCYYSLDCDIEAVSLQQYFCEVVWSVTTDSDNCEDILRLLVKCIVLSNGERMDTDLLKSVFELRYAAIAGFMPDLVGCAVCGKFDENLMYFDTVNGVLLCDDCKTDSAVLLNATLVTAMRHITYSPFDKLFGFSIPQQQSKRLSRITERYLLEQTEQRFRTLEFFNSIRC